MCLDKYTFFNINNSFRLLADSSKINRKEPIFDTSRWLMSNQHATKKPEVLDKYFYTQEHDSKIEMQNNFYGI